jgi:PPOX class probable F420-dependent enzyme
VKLADDEARARLVDHDHGVLATVHAVRGVDAVPVVYAVDGRHLAVPIDRVKPKSSRRLQRERNLEADHRATLLIESWDRDDWSQLWWVRATLRWDPDPDAERIEALATLLAHRYPQYADRPFAGLLVFLIVGATGWTADPTDRPPNA